MMLGGIALAQGCAQRQPAPERAADIGEALPGDLTISVTVFSEHEDPELIARLERWRRPARYIVEADWLLRAALGPGARESTFPTGTRQLTREDVEGLWRTLRGGGLLRIDHPARVGSVERVGAPPLGTTALVQVVHHGRVDSRRISMETGDADALAASALVDQLAALSWIRE